MPELKYSIRTVLSKYRISEGYTLENAENDLLDIFEAENSRLAKTDWDMRGRY